MPVRAVCKPHSPDLKRGALATDARGCSLWRDLLERPPPAPESRVRGADPCRGGYTRTQAHVCTHASTRTHSHTHSHACTHTSTLHTNTHTRTHARAHTLSLTHIFSIVHLRQCTLWQCILLFSVLCIYFFILTCNQSLLWHFQNVYFNTIVFLCWILGLMFVTVKPFYITCIY